jgi:hypothetical protein
LNKLTISEITRDNELLPLLADFTNVPEAQDIKMIADLLSSYPPITGDFFESEATRNKAITENTGQTGFSSLSYKKANTPQSEDTQAKYSKECNVDEYII